LYRLVLRLVQLVQLVQPAALQVVLRLALPVQLVAVRLEEVGAEAEVYYIKSNHIHLYWQWSRSVT
jgi:hypothetical protein